MTTYTLTELMRDAAASVGRAAERSAGGAVSPEDLAALVRGCRYTLREARRMHQTTEAILYEGSESKAFRGRCEADLAALDDAATSAAHVRRLADQAPPSKQRDAALARLDGVQKGLAALRRTYDEYMEVLNRPPRPIDPKRLEESYAAFARGDFESAQDIWARIQAGLEEP